MTQQQWTYLNLSNSPMPMSHFKFLLKRENYKCNLSFPVFVAQYQIFLFFYQVLYNPLWKVFCFVSSLKPTKQQCSHLSLATKPDYIVLTFMKVRQTRIPSCVR